MDRTEDGVKRETRVTIARDQVKWQFKLDTEERWDYSTPASAEDWDTLLEKVENRYSRRNATHADLLLVRRLHAASRGIV
jgi:Fe-S cluster assembly scaffold protein SufB